MSEDEAIRELDSVIVALEEAEQAGKRAAQALTALARAADGAK